jgi:hypothetical protein
MKTRINKCSQYKIKTHLENKFHKLTMSLKPKTQNPPIIKLNKIKIKKIKEKVKVRVREKEKEKIKKTKKNRKIRKMKKTKKIKIIK